MNWVSILALCLSSVVTVESINAHRVRQLENGGVDEPLSISEVPSDQPDKDDADWGNWIWPDDSNPSDWSGGGGPFSRCGGEGFEAPKACIQGWQCTQVAPKVSQCLPDNADVSIYTNEPTTPPSSRVPNDALPDTPSPTETLQVPTPQPPLRHTSNPPSEPSSTPVAPSGTQPSTRALIAAWKQCGGKGFDYSEYLSGTHAAESTQLPCQEGYACVVVNKWFYQCRPKTDPTKVQLWGQCGGKGYTGLTECIEGASCKKDSDYYSQCIPTSNT